MYLTPTEEDRLRVFAAAELARRTLAGGLRLNAPEAVALVCDAMHLAARGGASLEEVMEAGRGAVPAGQVMDGVAEIVDEIRLEVLLEEGSRVIVLHQPWGSGGADAPGAVRTQDLEVELGAGRERCRLTVRSRSTHPVRVSSHFPFWRSNPRLAFDRKRRGVSGSTCQRAPPSGGRRARRRMSAWSAMGEGGQVMTTPGEEGFRMPAEWGPHQATLMAWPTRTREAFWSAMFERAKQDYAAVARAVAAFEPVIMVCTPGEANEVRDRCGAGVEAIEIPIDDSWMRDSGPIFVSDQRGQVAMVHFRFNSWGGKYAPWDKDAAAPKAIAAHLGVRRYEAPFVLEGGAFLVDGEGTLVTTEGVLLNPNRNPGLSRTQIERGLANYLGVGKVIWLQAYPDRDTDGHVDGIAQYVGPGIILLETPADPANHNYRLAPENLRRLSEASDARGRSFEVLRFEPTGWSEVAGTAVEIPYLNCYLANGAVIMPAAGVPQDEQARDRIAGAFPDREVVCVPGAVLEYGGGGPHCITQQVPAGAYAR